MEEQQELHPLYDSITKLEDHPAFQEIYQQWLMSVAEYIDDHCGDHTSFVTYLDRHLSRLLLPLLIDPKAYYDCMDQLSLIDEQIQSRK